MAATTPGGSLCLRLGVGHALRWLVFASVGLVVISGILVASARGSAPIASWSSAWFDVAIRGFLFTSFLGIVVFQVAALRNRRVCVDGSELRVTGTFGNLTRFPRGLVDRVEQYRQITYVWSRFGTTLLLTRRVHRWEHFNRSPPFGSQCQAFRRLPRRPFRARSQRLEDSH